MNVDADAIRVIDSHTGGEPTRLVVAGGPQLGDGPLPQRVERFRREADDFRTMMLAEPRGYEAMVGALLCEPSDPSCTAAVIFFNNRGYLGMCGHGAIGVAVTLAYMGRIAPGRQLLETPVGNVAIDLIGPNRVAIENVPSYRLRKAVPVEVPGIGTVSGDIAWGGNWFYLVDSSPLPVVAENIDRLSDVAKRIRDALVAARITGADAAEIDHIELFGPATAADANSRNFVLCPGGAYDRSPCGTGTSAKLACLAADGKLSPNTPWIQESIIGSRFTATYRLVDEDRIVAKIVGEAFVYGETRFVAQPGDLFPYGIATK